MNSPCPRLMTASLRGGAGKTLLSVGIAVALRRRGLEVSPFKKGPDYIDAAWLSRAAGRPCINLDTFLMGDLQVVRSFSQYASTGDLALIEGNRGLFDGVNAEGTYSSAELAKRLRTPVILIVDCDKVTRTTAAMVLGCRVLDPDCALAGVILSRVGGKRHAAVAARAIETDAGLPVLGVVPRFSDSLLAERHLGLIPPAEQGHVRETLDWAGQVATDCLDLDGLLRIAAAAPSWAVDAFPRRIQGSENPVTVGVLQDRAFSFYYFENLEALRQQGARIVSIDALNDRFLPALDVLYIGGGFPETSAGALSENRDFRRSLCDAVERGLPVYAECGGLLYLGRSLTVKRQSYPMTGILPVSFSVEARPQGHGYVELEVDRDNPFFPVGTRLTGHEFHYARLTAGAVPHERTVYRVLRGTGLDGRRDGFCQRNILAGFSHLHASGVPVWAEAMVAVGRRYSARKGRHRAGRIAGPEGPAVSQGLNIKE